MCRRANELPRVAANAPCSVNAPEWTREWAIATITLNICQAILNGHFAMNNITYECAKVFRYMHILKLNDAIIVAKDRFFLCRHEEVVCLDNQFPKRHTCI